jgi:hypothetical protein
MQKRGKKARKSAISSVIGRGGVTLKNVSIVVKIGFTAQMGPVFFCYKETQ